MRTHSHICMCKCMSMCTPAPPLAGRKAVFSWMILKSQTEHKPLDLVELF